MSFALATWLFSACDSVPNDQIILNADEWSEKFSVEFHHSWWWSGEPTIIDYNIFVTKDGEKYKWKIEQKDWFFKNITEIESGNADALFDEIWRKLDSERITEATRDKKDEKVAFAKEAYKENVLNNKWHTKWETTIKYKK